MRILILCHAFNSLSQRLYVELAAAGHELTVEFDIHPAVTEEAVRLFAPDLVVAPFLKRAIPESVWSAVPCLVLHPGIPGDGGPTALDWAILDGVGDWGVTVIEARAELDAGPVWAWAPFAMREAAKSSLYRHEVANAAIAALGAAIAWFDRWRIRPPAPLGSPLPPPGRWRNAARQADRAIDWRDDPTAAVLRKIRSADGQPGVRTEIGGETLFLFDAHPAPGLSGPPGAAIARSGEAMAVATADGAVWIGHLREAATGAVKLPAARVFRSFAALPEIAPDDPLGFSRIAFEERNGVGYLNFPFYNGAMGVEAGRALTAAFERACAGAARVIVLCGGPDFWSNGMDLNRIETAERPADESWANINALDDLAEAIIRASDRLVIAALEGNAGAGGVFLARAADEVLIRDGVILNPHYKDMGNLAGSEFWTYLLPAVAGPEQARRIMARRLPMGAAEAVETGLADAAIAGDGAAFRRAVAARAEALAAGPALDRLLAEKAVRRARDEAEKPLNRWREEELAAMRRSFYGFDQSYHVARHNFVRKVPKSRTPITLARHRALGAGARGLRTAS